MKERSKLFSKLQRDSKFRASYIRKKLSVLIPAQIRAVRAEKTQKELATDMRTRQSRISAMETPGAANFSLRTLIRLAAVLKVGLMVRFVSFSEMLRWESEFTSDSFEVTPIDDETEFSPPAIASGPQAVTLTVLAPKGSTVTLSWEQAKYLRDVLTDLVKRYENKNGKFKVPTNPR